MERRTLDGWVSLLLIAAFFIIICGIFTLIINARSDRNRDEIIKALKPDNQGWNMIVDTIAMKKSPKSDTITIRYYKKQR